MATATSTIVYNTPTAGAAVTSNKPISDLLQSLVTAGVLTQLTDSGQISWASITSTQTGVLGYELYKLNDSNASAAPIILKFVYASNAPASTSLPQITVQIGVATDGAGNFTGQATPAQVFRGFGAADTTSRSIFASAGEGYFTLFGDWNTGTFPNNSLGGFALVVERLRDTSGNILTTGLVALGTFAGGSTSINAVPTGTSLGAIGTGNPWLIGMSAGLFSGLSGMFNTAGGTMNWPPISTQGGAVSATQMFDGTNFVIATCFPKADKLYGAMTALLIADFGSFAEWSTTSLTVYGTSHTYWTGGKNLPMPYGGWSVSGVSALTGTVGHHTKQPLIRFE